jgi:hypothetical protein
VAHEEETAAKLWNDSSLHAKHNAALHRAWRAEEIADKKVGLRREIAAALGTSGMTNEMIGRHNPT